AGRLNKSRQLWILRSVSVAGATSWRRQVKLSLRDHVPSFSSKSFLLMPAPSHERVQLLRALIHRSASLCPAYVGCGSFTSKSCGLKAARLAMFFVPSDWKHHNAHDYDRWPNAVL